MTKAQFLPISGRGEGVVSGFGGDAVTQVRSWLRSEMFLLRRGKLLFTGAGLRSKMRFSLIKRVVGHSWTGSSDRLV